MRKQRGGGFLLPFKQKFKITKIAFSKKRKDNQNKTYSLYGETKGLFERKKRSDEGLSTGKAVGS